MLGGDSSSKWEKEFFKDKRRQTNTHAQTKIQGISGDIQPTSTKIQNKQTKGKEEEDSLKTDHPS